MTKNRSKHSGRAAEASRRAVAAQASTPKARPGVRPPVPASSMAADVAGHHLIPVTKEQARRMAQQGYNRVRWRECGSNANANATPTNKGEHAEGAARAIVSRGEASSMAQARRMVRQGYTSNTKERRPR